MAWVVKRTKLDFKKVFFWDTLLWNQVWERLEKSNSTTNKNLCVPETKIGTKSQSNYAMVESMLPFRITKILKT